MGTQSWQGEQGTSHNNGLVDQAKGAVSEVADAAKEQVGSQIGNQKGRLAEQIGGVAKALRDTSSQLEENEEAAFVSGYVEKAASQVERLADYLESRDVSDLLGEVQNLARREPAIFLGGLFTLGLVAGRFLKSSAPRTPQALEGAGGSWQRQQGRSQAWTSEWDKSSSVGGSLPSRGSASSQSYGSGGGSGAATGSGSAASGASFPISGAPPVPRPRPDVIPPAPIRDVGAGSSGSSAGASGSPSPSTSAAGSSGSSSATGSTGAGTGSSSATTTTPGTGSPSTSSAMPSGREPRGGSGGR
jgi:archaellum component FlaC